MKFPMKLKNLMINDLLNENEKLTFLVGAGCSVDPPSCLPMGRQMMEAVIKYTCTESEIEKILAICSFIIKLESSLFVVIGFSKMA